MKRTLKRCLAVLGAVTVASALLVWLIPLKLAKTADRPTTYTLPTALSAQIKKDAFGMEVDQIMDYSLSLTASQLRFSTRNDIAHGKANCVGYAQMCAAVCNQALAVNGIDGRACAVVGHIDACGLNLCELFTTLAPKQRWRDFVKDHDFVELTIGSGKYCFDPGIYDVLAKKCTTFTM